MTKTRIIALLLVLVMVMGVILTGCTPPAGNNGGNNGGNGGEQGGNGGEGGEGNKPEEDLTFKLEYAEGTLLRMAAGYQKTNTAISFDAATVADYGVDGVITLADGKEYHTGDLKPTWVEVQNVLGVRFEDKFTGAGSAEKEFNVWKEKLDEVDMVSGSASVLTEAGTAGNLINIAEYLDDMPNFKKYLEENPIVRLSITSPDANGDLGAIYFSPYFDGVNDIERMPLMRTDWVEKLLNGEGDFEGTTVSVDVKDKDGNVTETITKAYNNLNPTVYTPYMPTSGKVSIDVVKPDGSATETITKDYDKAGNIVATMNAAGELTGVEAVNMLRDYIDEAYNGYYGTNRADLFIGQNAAWDADELVALLRCVVANPQTLNGTHSVQGLFSREDNNNQRRVDMFRFTGTLFGVRGLESRQDYLYVGADGFLHDARQEEATYVALERVNAMVQEGLISDTFIKGQATNTAQMLENDMGFMHYDYNQTQTINNETKLQEGEKYMAVMVPVARWFDGTDPNGVYMRFTESWRSVKTDGWAISKAGVGNDTNKLHAALALIDYAYSAKGQILMSYGPDAFIKTDTNGDYVTFNFNGKEMPVIAEATYAELWDKAGGNYTNYARYFLGSTLSFVKSQAFEYQCTHEVGREGAGHISTAIGLGTIKHPELAVTDNPWYSIVPTTLPTSKEANDAIADLTELSSNGFFSQAKGKTNLLLDIIVKGYAEAGVGSRAEIIKSVSETWGGDVYLLHKQDAYDLLLDYYKSIK